MAKKKAVVKEAVVEVVYPSEQEQLMTRRVELETVREYLTTNRFNDIGQVEQALAQINLRLSQI